jgi:hypothetical protein
MHTSVEKIVGLLKDYGLENAIVCDRTPKNKAGERGALPRKT